MNPVSAQPAVVPVGNVNVPPPDVGGARTQSALLAQPTPATGNGLNDAMSMIYVLMEKQGQIDMKSGASSVQQNKALREKALKDQHDALVKREQAESSDHGFLSCVGDILGDVAKASFGDLKAFSDLGSDCAQAWNSPQFWRDLASGAGSVLKTLSTVCAIAVASAVAGPMGAAYVIDHPDSPLTKACSIAGEAALTAATGGAASAVIVGVAVALSVAGSVVSESRCFGDASGLVGAGLDLGSGALGNGSGLGAALQVAQGAATVVEGAATIRVAKFDGDAQDALADMKAGGLQSQKLERLVKFLLDDMKGVHESHQRALSSLKGAIETNSQTQLMAASINLKG